MLPLHAEQTDELRLADWLELRALLAPDASSSTGDLERVLTREDAFNGDRQQLEIKIADVVKELEHRVRAAGTGYPFTCVGGTVAAKPEWKKSSYVFCLCLSYAGCVQERGSKTYPARIFEALSTEAARVYISAPGVEARAVRFGSPRHAKDLPAGFKEAIERLCSDEHIREGGGWRPGARVTSRTQPKDEGLDVVAWRNWPDLRSGKLMLWGACAAGSDWESKTNDIMPDAFTSLWLANQPVTKILRAFFVPHRVHDDRWDMVSVRAGIVFERCRISSLVSELPASAHRHGKPAQWLAARLKELQAA